VSKSAKSSLDFRSQWPLKSSGFELEQRIGSLRHALEAQMIDLNKLRYFAHTLPNFLQVRNLASVWPLKRSGSKQSTVSKT